MTVQVEESYTHGGRNNTPTSKSPGDFKDDCDDSEIDSDNWDNDKDTNCSIGQRTLRCESNNNSQGDGPREGGTGPRDGGIGLGEEEEVYSYVYLYVYMCILYKVYMYIFP